MAVDVPEERLLAPVHELDGPIGVQREQAGVDLHREILARPERAADAGERDAHLLGLEVEAHGELVAVDVQPLRRDVEVDAALAVGHGEPRLGAEERLILHADLVLALDDHVGLAQLGVAVADRHVAQQVAARVQPRRVGQHRELGVVDDRQHLVLDLDEGRGPARGLGMVGGDERDRLALVAHLVPGEHRLVGMLEPEGLAPRARPRASARRRRRASRAPRPISIERMRACGWGLRTVAPQSMRSACRSEE